MSVVIQTHDFDIAYEISNIQQKDITGAVVSFTGLVRGGGEFKAIQIEHYPKAAEKNINTIINTAKTRWNILNAKVIHRIGMLKSNEQIVLVVVSAKHRKEAFSACEFIMDFLKSDAPFWKKEITKTGDSWVDKNQKDTDALQKWQTK